jgi:stage II sporulation protein D
MGRGFRFFALSVLGCTAAPLLGARPLSELRILVAKIPARSQDGFRFEGQALMDAKGKPLRNDKVSCHREASIASPLLSGDLLPSGPISWLCKSGSLAWTIKPSLRFTDRSGFMRIGRKWYRGALDLVTRGEVLYVINAVPVEDYLSGLMHGEMPHAFEAEALKAQAVAARSYAVATALERRARGQVFDLTDNTRDQMYPGAHTESEKGGKAVRETSDEYLLAGNTVLKSFYHAASGGHSELPANVWGGATPLAAPTGFDAQLNPWDKGAYAWNLQLSPALFARYPELGEIVDIQVSRLTEGFRVSHIKILGSQSEREMTIQDLEALLGASWIKSRKFEIVKEAKSWKLSGEGWGHGVGLSQVAANNMAKAGKTYREILEFHYPKASVQKMKSESEGKVLAGPRAR